MNETQKPFACAREGCKMAFTNEDHLNVHKKKHDMALHLGIDSQSNSAVADQTPTPTRFIRNCEEVGLFQDLQNVNPFDETFRKATELAKAGGLHIPETSTDDTLHTPHIFPHIEEENSSINKFSRNNSNDPQFTVTTIDVDLLKLSHKANESVKTEVLLLTDENSDSEKGNERNFLTQNSSIIDNRALISKDNLISNNAHNIVPFPIPLADSDLPPVVVNNLSDIEISINKSDRDFKSRKAEETIKSKLKDAIKSRVKADESTSEVQDPILMQKIENSSLFSTELKLVKPLQRRIFNKHTREDKSKTKAGNSGMDNVRNMLIHDGLQIRNINALKRGRILLSQQSQLERQREVNRAAQVRSRERKKYWISQMEAEIAQLKEEKRDLWLENQNLKDEVVWLKTMLLYHKDCPIAKDPRIMEEVTTLMKTTKGELQKKMQKIPFVKKVVPIRPTPPNVIAFRPVPNSLLVQVPTPGDSGKGAIQITTLPTVATQPSVSMKNSVAIASSTTTTVLSKLASCSVMSSEQSRAAQNSNNVQISPAAAPNIIIGIVNQTNPTLGNSKDTKRQSKIMKAKNKLKIDFKKDKRLRNNKASSANLLQLPNAILSEDNYYLVAKPSEMEKPKYAF